MLAMNYRIFCIWLILLLCVGVFTTGVSRACLCELTCLCCKSQGLQYETGVTARPLCGCCSQAEGIPCCDKKIPDVAGSSAGDHSEKGCEPIADITVILADHLFDNHSLSHFAQTTSIGSTTKASSIHLQNQSLLL